MFTLIWTIVFILGIGAFAWQCWGRLGLLLKARKDDARDYSLATLGPRIKNTLVYAFGQKKFFGSDQPAGIMHAIIFWGFLVLGIQVVTMFARGWLPEFRVPGFQVHQLGSYYALLKDFFQLGVLVAVCIAIIRWTVVKPQRLMGFLPAEAKLNSQSHGEAVVILLFIALIMLSGFFYDAANLVAFAGDPDLAEEASWQPITAWLASFFPDDRERAGLIAQTSWWVHNGIILLFLNLLPRSKHFHIITAIPNVFLGKVEPYGRLRKSDFTNEEDPMFGRSKAEQFTWKQVLDMFSCTECGRCAAVCPATASGKPLAPRQFLLNLRDNFYDNQFTLTKRTGTDEGEVIIGEGKAVVDDVIWSCNACRACEEACPVNIEYVDKIIDIRQHLVQEESRFPEELNQAFKGLENNSNPWGIGAEERDAWAQGMDIPRIADNPNVEYLYFVGCGGAFDPNNKNTTMSFAKILLQAGVSFGILGKDELCNGETARRLGNEYLFQTMAEQLVEKINATKISKIIVNCPHCFNTMANEYPEFGGKWEVIRAATLVEQLIKDGKIKLNKNMDKKVVYHDSCYYARFNDIVDEPRNILSQIPGARIEEMDQSKKQGNCCGAGGGRMWMEEEATQRVNHQRVDQALTKNPDVLAVSCPYCRIMLGNAVTDKGKDSQVAVMDMMQIVESQMEKSPS